MRRRRLRRLLLAVALAALCALGTGLFPQEPLRRLVEGRLRASLGPDVQLRRLHVVPALLRADLEGLEIRGPRLEAVVPRGRLQVSFGTLLGRELVVEALEIESPRLLLRAGRGPASGSAPGLFVVRRVAVRDAQLELAFDAGRLQLRGLEAHGSLGGGRLTLGAGSGAWSSAGSGTLELRSAAARLLTDVGLDATLEQLEVQTAASRLEAHGSLGPLLAPRLGLELTGHLSLAEARGLAELPEAEGEVDVTGRLDGPVAGLASRWRLTGQQLRLATWAVDDLQVALEQARVALPWEARARAHALGGALSLEGRADRERIEAQLTLEGLDTEALRRQLQAGREPLPGRVSGRASLRGPLAGELETQAALQARLALAGRVAAVTLEGRGRVSRASGPDLALTATAETATADRQARLASLNLSAQGRWRGGQATARLDGTAGLRAGADPQSVSITGEVAVEGETWSASLDARPPHGSLAVEAKARGTRFERLAVRARDLAANLLAAGVEGSLDADFDGHGPVEALDGSLAAHAAGLAVGPVQVGALGVDGGLSAGRAQVALAASDLGATGRLAVAEGQARLELDLSSTPLERLSGAAAAGDLDGRLQVRIPFAHPEEAEGQARLASVAIRREGLTLASREPFTLELGSGRLRLAPMVLEGPGGHIGLEGTLGLRERQPGLSGALSVDADLATLPLPTELERQGRVEGQVVLGGTVERPEATGSLAWRGVEVAMGDLPRLVLEDGRVELLGRRLRLDEARGRWAGGTLRLAGELPGTALWPSWRRRPDTLGPGEGAALRLEWQGLDVRLLRPVSEEDEAALAGRLEGALVVDGGLAGWDEVRARLAAPATELGLGAATLRFSPLDLDLRDGLVGGSPLTLDTAAGQLVLSGQADLVRRQGDLALKGQLELRALSALAAEAALSGVATVDLHLRGPLAGLRPQGSVLVHDGGLRLRMLPQAITGLRADLELDEEGWLRLPQGEAELGGGTLLLGGQARVIGARVEDVAFALSARGAALSYPPGLRSRLDADLRLTGRSGALLLAGKVKAQRGRYDLDQALNQSLFSREERATTSPLLRSVGLELDLLVREPLRLVSRRFSFDQVSAAGALSLRGDLETPLPYGRLELAPNGRLTLQGPQPRELRLEQGLLTYSGDWDARISLQAASRVELQSTQSACGFEAGQNLDLTARVAGTLNLPELSASGGGLGGDKALALLVTGRCDADLAGVGTVAAGGQADAFLGDTLTRGLGEQLRQIGLDEVTITPQLLARDEDPGARFTFGKRLGRHARVVYSTALNLPESQWFRLDLGPWRTLTSSVKRADKGDWTATAGQRLEWGGPAAKSPTPRGTRPRLELAEIAFEGSLPLPEARLRQVLGLEVGQRIGTWTLLDRTDALREWLQEQGFLEAEVGGRLEGAIAHVRIQPGPRYAWRVLGAPEPAGFARLLRTGLFAEEALELGRARIERDLRRQGYLQARVRTRVERQDDGRLLVFEAEPGLREALLGVSLRGAAALSQKHLLARAGGAGAVAAEPAAARRIWLQAYRERHFLEARVEGPRLVREAGGVRLEADIDEGAPARIAAIDYPGATLDRSRLDQALRLRTGDRVEDQALTAAALRLRDLYQELGYPEVRVTLAAEPVDGDLALHYAVAEGPRATIREVRVEGLTHMRRSVVLERANLEPGQPLDPRRVLAAEQRVQSLGGFASVGSETLPEDGVVRLLLREAPRFLARYELRWEEHQGLGGQLDGEVRHLLGRGLVLGGRYAQSRDIKDARAFFTLPVRHGLLLVSGSRFEESLSGVIPTLRVERELRVQQTMEPARWWKVLAGYRFKRVTVEPVFPLPFDVAALEPALVRDSRSNVLDPRSGRLYSLGLSLADTWLGSQTRYAKGLAQFNVYSTHGTLTWAQGYRLGLGWGFGGQRIVSTERFKAGGASSLRGFATDALGPVDFLGGPAGGEAVLLFNQELRYRHPSGLGAVAFYDAGNVFDRASDLSLSLRHAVGVGVRYASPVGLLRLDLGIPLTRREGDKSYQLFFSLGQAF